MDEKTGSASEDTRSVVEEFLRRVGEGDAERIAALFAEEVDWMIADNPVVPWIRPRQTREDVAAHFTELAAGVAALAGGGRPVDVLVVDGTEAVITGTLSGRVRATGKEFSTPYALRLSVQNGELTRYYIFEDSLKIAAACTA
ncbi:nuclear transport factor 2 family protein [Streptomyces iconiensis]|uniref:Nuclear transport factor 2 family protein n=1 Tax=Streptomyces iconiensis TaxID=1384038 RepID=A0ABT7AAE7_9ACTN|nr:nuclear transport factor 2 family protein [Streptomyces iconiensis]MDJ1138307.1 nuclear transport factor 2 family protein [Streptomyces iconiensis]